MPIYLDTRGRSTLGIGICARCSTKMSLEDLHPDPNSPGLYVCDEDRDELDKYRLPCIPADRINLPFTRPDVPLTGRGPAYIYAFQNFGLTQINPTLAWQPETRYERGDSVTPLSVDLDTTTLPQTLFVCIVPGVSGASAPAWPTVLPGQMVGNFNYLVDDNGATVHQANVLISDHPTITEALVSDLFNGDGTVGWLSFGNYLLGRTQN
jgi:hypothetical protein